MTELEFYLLTDSAYPWIGHHPERPSVGIDLPTSEYGPDHGQHTFERMADRAILAEKLGFDGLVIVEQHGGPVGLIGNAMLGATWFASITNGIKIAPVGPLLNAYSSPVRLAEEIAAVDNISNGRLIVGLPLGIGMQYHSMGVANPSLARAQYREANELLLKALDSDKPFAWEGEFYNVPYVNVWPKPLQRPRPEFFLPAAGSKETLELCAKYGYVYQAVLVPRPILLKNIEIFREACRSYGYEPEPKQLAIVLPVHVAETDEQARRELEPHMAWRNQNIFNFPFDESFPPGHVTERSLRGMMAGGYRSAGNDPAKMNWDDLIERGWIVAGSPESVCEQLELVAQELGAGRLIIVTNDTMPAWLEQKWMTMFAERVMPAFRRDGRPVWDRERTPAYRTRSEFGARDEKPAGMPVARDVDGRDVDLRSMYLGFEGPDAR